MRSRLAFSLLVAAGLLGPSPAQAAVTHQFEKVVALGANQPVGVAIGSAGGLYVASTRDVVRLSSAGEPAPFECSGKGECSYVEGDRITGTPGGSFGRVGGVAVDDATGEEFVSAGRVVDVFAATGKFLGQITEVPGTATVPGPFTEPSGLAFDQATGDVYVTDARITEGEEPSRRVVDVFAVESPGKATFVAPQIIRAGSERPTVAVAEEAMLGLVEPGTVYVGMGTPETHARVNVFNALGGFESEWTGAQTPAKGFNETSVGIDPVGGHVFVADKGFGVVDEFGSASVTEAFVGHVASPPAAPWEKPVAVAADPEHLYVGAFDTGTGEWALYVLGGDVPLPEAVTDAASELTPVSAKLNGTVSTSTGGPASCVFAWGTSEALEHQKACSPDPVEGEAVQVSSELGPGAGTPLERDTKYFFQVRAVSEASGVESEPEATAECEGVKSTIGCFTAPGPGIHNESVSEVASTAASLQATVNPNNKPTSVYFQYSSQDTTACTATPASSSCPSVPAPPGAAIGSGNGDVVVPGQEIRGLSPGFVYHYRVIAVSELEPGHPQVFAGADQTFMTQATGSSSALPDARQWQLVSPPDKHGALIEGINTEPLANAGVVQAAADGNAITWLASQPTETEPAGYDNNLQALSTRTGMGWRTRSTSHPPTSSPPPRAPALATSTGSSAKTSPPRSSSRSARSTPPSQTRPPNKPRSNTTTTTTAANPAPALATSPLSPAWKATPTSHQTPGSTPASRARRRRSAARGSRVPAPTPPTS